MQRDDLVVIVTGGARGLGRAMVEGMLRAGRRVAAVDLPSSNPDMATLVSTALSEKSGNRLLTLFGDVTKAADCAAVVDATVRHFGSVHGLVNNAARGMPDRFFEGRKRKFFEIETDSWFSSVNINLNGPFNMAKAVTPSLLKQGWGRVVNVTTDLEVMLAEGQNAYGPSKAGLEAASKIWSLDIANTGVTVNVLGPGGRADTDMVTTDYWPERSDLLRPNIMVAPIVWLMSRLSDGVTGRRFTAKDWDPSLNPLEAAGISGAPIGW
jgi:3-oxoacyl-[acyl-carrier protein] reductase